MHTTMTFQECQESVASDMRQYWTSEQKSLESLLKGNSTPEPQLDLRVSYEPATHHYAARAVLPLIGGTLTAEARDENARAVLDEVVNLLARGMKRPVEEEKLVASYGDSVDATSADSFPASDPPSWTPVTAAGPPTTSDA
jgi:hypothetical protein